eukprot:1156631-Pelagomonas_calceolata.AAC.4
MVGTNRSLLCLPSLQIPPGGTLAPVHATVGLKPKREWKVLEGGPQAAVTALHANALGGGLLFTGATDGSVAMCVR